MSRVQSGLLYVDEDKIECDFCDNIKKCASIRHISGNIMIICKDCLKEFMNYIEE